MGLRGEGLVRRRLHGEVGSHRDLARFWFLTGCRGSHRRRGWHTHGGEESRVVPRAEAGLGSQRSEGAGSARPEGRHDRWGS